MSRHTVAGIALIAVVVLIAGMNGCDELLTKAPEPDQSFEGPIDGLTNEQQLIFTRGDEAFGEVFTFETGLGPLFNQASCERCHVGDGRGHPSTNLRRFGRNDGNAFDPLIQFGGPQLQERSRPGYPAETIPSQANAVSVRGGPLVTGLGLIEAIPYQTVLAHADPNDADADGISGRPNLVDAPEFLDLPPGPINGKHLGRFGRKAGAINLLQQTATAYHQDMGITTDFIPDENRNPAAGGNSGDPVPDPEIPGSTVQDVVFYLQTLRSPQRRDAENPIVQRGETIFSAIKCASCHVPSMTTGPHPVQALSNREVPLFSDILLHDMGPDLADDFYEGEATGTEWRTTPLWGLGIVENILGGTPFFLHDGRTSDLRVVIDLHKGEASASRAAFQQLPPEDQDALLMFLKSL